MASTQYDLQAVFEEVCTTGTTSRIIEVLDEDKSGQIDIHVGNERAFQFACEEGDTFLFDKLVSLEPTRGKIDIHAVDEFAFTRACKNGHLPIFDRLIGLEETHGQIDIHASNELALGLACWCEHPTIAAKIVALQHTHGEIAPNRIKEIAITKTGCFSVSEIEKALENHTFVEASVCIQPVVKATADVRLKQSLIKILAAKARAQLTERDIASPALRL